MKCNCSASSKHLVFACSGAANTGYLADQVARRLNLQGDAKMFCLAAIGAELEGYLKSARDSELNLVIDGCPTGCGRKIFERLGLPHTSFVLTELGVEKGKTLIDEAVIADMTQRIQKEVPQV
ncbi:putative zinc-binding protein [Holophaga foetida]|uniref:putative zinc-binding protein n=1 Tax=Holophaga foetida TaxID=35839 RepID=UPI0002475027|nr:putative zinc-binding protein [Holophaga foetida]